MPWSGTFVVKVLFTSTLQMLDSWTLWNLDENWGTLNLDVFFGRSCLCTLLWHELCSYCFYHLFIMCWWMSYKSHWLLRNFWCPYFNSQRSFWMSVWIGAWKENSWYACDSPRCWGCLRYLSECGHFFTQSMAATAPARQIIFTKVQPANLPQKL